MGYKIKEIREAQKLTQEELAEKAGVSRATIAKIETIPGYTTTTKTLYKVAVALGVKWEDIFFVEAV